MPTLTDPSPAGPGAGQSARLPRHDPGSVPGRPQVQPDLQGQLCGADVRRGVERPERKRKHSGMLDDFVPPRSVFV